MHQSFQGLRYPGLNNNGIPFRPSYTMNGQPPFQYGNGFQQPMNPPNVWTNAAFVPRTPRVFTNPQIAPLNGFHFGGSSLGLRPEIRVNRNQINGMSVTTPLQTFSGSESQHIGLQTESTPNTYTSMQGYQSQSGTSQQPGNYQKTSIQNTNFYRFSPGMSSVNQPTSIRPLDALTTGLPWSPIAQPSHRFSQTYYSFIGPFGSSRGMTQRNIPMAGLNVPQQNPGFDVPSLLPMGPQSRNKYNPNFSLPTTSQTGRQNSGYPLTSPVVPQFGQVPTGINFPSNIPVAPQPGQLHTGLNFPSNVPVRSQPGQFPTGLNFPSNVPGEVNSRLNFPLNVPVAPQPAQPGQMPTGLNFPSNVPVAPQPGKVSTGLNFPSNVPVAPQLGLNFPSNVPVASQPGQVNTGLNFPSNVPVAPQPTMPSVRPTPSPPTPRRFTACPALNDPGKYFLTDVLH